MIGFNVMLEQYGPLTFFSSILVIWGRYVPSKWLKRAPNGIKLNIGAISRSDGSEMMEPCGTRWKKSGHIRGDALEPFLVSGGL